MGISQTHGPARRELLHAVTVGMWGRPKRLPLERILDDECGRLLDAIGALPEFHWTRREECLLERHVEDVLAFCRAAPSPGVERRVNVVELSAAAAAPPSALCAGVLSALVVRQGRTVFCPAPAPPFSTHQAPRHELDPRIEVRAPRRSDAPGSVPCGTMGTRGAPLAADVRRSTHTPSSIDLNVLSGAALSTLDDHAAVGLLSQARAQSGPRAVLLIGAPGGRDVTLLLAAHDDAHGLTAALNKRVLVRLNRDFRARFDPEAFAHRVRWNGVRAAVELHLESLRSHRVRFDALGAWVEFARGETIQTGSRLTFDDARLDSLLARAGWRRERTFADASGLMGLSCCRWSAL